MRSFSSLATRSFFSVHLQQLRIKCCKAKKRSRKDTAYSTCLIGYYFLYILINSRYINY
jgi:hypothetical protein